MKVVDVDFHYLSPKLIGYNSNVPLVIAKRMKGDYNHLIPQDYQSSSQLHCYFLLLLSFEVSTVNSDLYGLNTELSCYVDGKSHEVKSQLDAAVSRLASLQQVTTDGRLVQSVARHLVAAQMKLLQWLNVLITNKHNNI